MESSLKVLVLGGCPQNPNAAVDAGVAIHNEGRHDVIIYTTNNCEIPPEASNMDIYKFAGHTGSLGLHDVKIIQNINPDVIAIGYGMGNDFDAKKAILAIVNTDKQVIIAGDAVVRELLMIHNPSIHKWVILCDEYQASKLGLVEADTNTHFSIKESSINYTGRGKVTIPFNSQKLRPYTISYLKE